MKLDANTTVYNACAHCGSAHLCSPPGLSNADQARLNILVHDRIRVFKGFPLYEPGDPCTAVYSVRTGSFKTQMQLDNGQVRVSGFVLQGEILGLDGLSKNQHQSTAIALEDSEVCVLSLNRLDDIFAKLPSVHCHFVRILSSEINRVQTINMDLALLTSEQRVANFLLSMSDRLQHLGYSPREFHLRMKRSDIANYLGLTLETISRTLSRFNKEGYIKAHHKHILIENREALVALLKEQH